MDGKMSKKEICRLLYKGMFSLKERIRKEYNTPNR